jgi:hypothetical protein
VVCTCHLKLKRGQREVQMGGSRFQDNLGKKKISETPNSMEKVECGGMHLSSLEGRKHKIGRLRSRVKRKLYLQNNQSKKGLEVWLKW